MGFLFYPKHEHGCPHVGHCPHLGGAALGTLVNLANANRDVYQAQLRTIDQQRETLAEQRQRIEELEKQVEQLKLELKLERQNKFKKNPEEEQDEATAIAPETPATSCRKRGAPPGHPGWFRPRPTTIDRTIPVPAPKRCPLCGAAVRAHPDDAPEDHLQEDILDGRRQTTCFRHERGRCTRCRRWVKQAGPGELLRKQIGPAARALATFLRVDIGISTRKVPRALGGISGLAFVAATTVAVSRDLAQRAAPLVEDIEKKLASTDGAVYADETGWRVDGESGEFWFHGNRHYAHFHWDESRAGEVSRRILGDDFGGILVTDCYAAYLRHAAQAKQKCLVHLARSARDWRPLAVAGQAPQAVQFFDDVKTWVKRGCRYHRQRKKLTLAERAQEESWLREELLRLEQCELDHDKARTLQQRLRDYHDDWLVFLDYEEVDPTNNLAERALRPLVVLRKLTFGSRSPAGARWLAWLLTVIETAKRHGHTALDFLYQLQARSPSRALRYLYDTS